MDAALRLDQSVPLHQRHIRVSILVLVDAALRPPYLFCSILYHLVSILVLVDAALRLLFVIGDRRRAYWFQSLF